MQNGNKNRDSLAYRLLRLFLSGDDRDPLSGNFELFYNEIMEEYGRGTALFRLLLQILKSLPGLIVIKIYRSNLMLSNSLLTILSDKLCRSRMQRDLSDSTVERNIGVALSHSYLALTETMRGLQKVRINEAKCRRDLEESPELLAEPLQTILRTANVEDPYTLLKQFTRGKTIVYDELLEFIEKLDIDKNLKNILKGLQLTSYIGDAVRICERVLDLAEKEFGLL